MKKIINNYLCLNSKEEFNQQTLNYFFDRLSLFLNFVIKDKPKLKVKIVHKRARAEYDHHNHLIIFALDRYKLNSQNNTFDTEVILTAIGEQNGYQYAIPLADIYHELIHVYQFLCTGYRWAGYIEHSDGFVEAVDEMLTTVLTGHELIDYDAEVYALWFLMKRKLNIKKPTEQYNFMRNAVVNPNFITELMAYPNMKPLLDKKYSGSIELFLRSFVKDFGNKKHFTECITDLMNIHNLIFYRW